MLWVPSIEILQLERRVVAGVCEFSWRLQRYDDWREEMARRAEEDLSARPVYFGVDWANNLRRTFRDARIIRWP